MHRSAFSLALALLFASAGPALCDELRLPLFHGEWALNGQHCGEVYGRGVAEDNFITIGRGTFQMYESSCQITRVTKLNQTDWATSLKCSSEGETFTRKWSIKKHSPYSFTVLDGAGRGGQYQHCR